MFSTWSSSKIYCFSLRTCLIASLKSDCLTFEYSIPGNESLIRSKNNGTSLGTNLDRFVSLKKIF